MTEHLPSLNALRAFETVARHLSFSKAAVELHVTQAAVSQQVKALEADLGTPLLRRANRRIYLTETGQAGLADLRLSFDRMALAVHRMRVDARRELLTIRVEPTFAASWLVARLDSFRDACDGVDILIDASLDLPDFDRDGVDVAIHFGTGDYPGLSFQQLFKDKVFPVCSPRLLDGPPPLREPGDRAELREALADGTLDAVCSDHRPNDGEAKRQPFARCAAGVAGFEALLPLALDLVSSGVPLARAIAAVTSGPAAVLGGGGRIGIGALADLCVLAPQQSWTVSVDTWRSAGVCTPVWARVLRGRVTRTLLGLRTVHRLEETASGR